VVLFCFSISALGFEAVRRFASNPSECIISITFNKMVLFCFSISALGFEAVRRFASNPSECTNKAFQLILGGFFDEMPLTLVFLYLIEKKQINREDLTFTGS
jgi:hypothetical protein